jgi:hypothetical protein
MTERRFPRPSAHQTRSGVRTLVKLVVFSLLVGAVLALFGWNPIELWKGLWNTLEQGVVDIFGTGIGGLALIGTLIATGAVIVVPLWLISKLLGSRRR